MENYYDWVYDAGMKMFSLFESIEPETAEEYYCMVEQMAGNAHDVKVSK